MPGSDGIYMKKTLFYRGEGGGQYVFQMSILVAFLLYMIIKILDLLKYHEANIGEEHNVYVVFKWNIHGSAGK